MRVQRRTHPDLYVLEPLGDQIRIDDIRELRRDLHMRPFEASRRVYVLFGADTMNEDAADALLKDLEEPPPYAMIVLVADDLGPLPETIRSRCQLVPFRRLSEQAVSEAIRARAAGAHRRRGDDARARRRRQARPRGAAARPRSGEAARDAARASRGRSTSIPRSTPADGAQALLQGIAERGAEAKEQAEESVAVLELTGREAEQRVRRSQRGAERDELLAVLEELEWWYRDLVVVAAGAEARGRARRPARRAAGRRDARAACSGPSGACELVRAAWREAEELQLSVPLALEALLVRLRRELVGRALTGA